MWNIIAIKNNCFLFEYIFKCNLFMWRKDEFSAEITFTFTFSHLADAFIQSDLQLGVHKAINLEEANIQRKFQ